MAAAAQKNGEGPCRRRRLVIVGHEWENHHHFLSRLSFLLLVSFPFSIVPSSDRWWFLSSSSLPPPPTTFSHISHDFLFFSSSFLLLKKEKEKQLTGIIWRLIGEWLSKWRGFSIIRLVHRQQSFKWHYTTADMQFISFLLCFIIPPSFNPSLCIGRTTKPLRILIHSLWNTFLKTEI